MSSIELIVGLGNPGPKYEATRHNAGFWFVEALARARGQTFKLENKYHAELARVESGAGSLWLLKPNTYMNRSGQAVMALAGFYKIPLSGILVVHDELDIPPGTVRLKQGGGAGGHNGLRDIIAQGGGNDFWRLRIGIGHPGHASEVTDFVLGKAPAAERHLIEDVIASSLQYLPAMLDGQWQKVMNHLHSIKPASKPLQE